MATSDFFADDTPHSHAKRIMLKKFLQAFVPVSYERTVQFGKRIDGFVIIDGFAGEGKYGEGWPSEIDQYGSPLIALMVTLNFLYKQTHQQDIVWNIGEESISSKMTIDEDNEGDILNHIPMISRKMASLLFVEENRKRFDKLVSNIDTIFNFFKDSYTVCKKGSRGFIINGREISCTIMNCSFAELSDCFPSTSLHRRACFTFVDPFGYSQTPMNSIKRFVGDENKTLLMNFMSGPVNRFVSTQPEHVAKLYGIAMPKKQDNTTDDHFKRKIVDYLKEQIRRSPPGYTSTSCNIQKCAINFQMTLEEKSGQHLSLLFEMRGESNVPIYHLVLLAGHPKGYEKMKEAMNRVTQYELEMKFSDFDIIRRGHIVNLSNMQDNAKVADVIFKRYKGRHLISYEEIKRFIMHKTPYVFRNKSLSIMEKEENPRITSVAGGTRKRRRYTFPEGQNWMITFRMETLRRQPDI